MRNRSRIHMLTVAAARLEGDHANPKLVADIRAAAKEAATAKADGRGWTPEETRRVERQRTLFAMLPSTNATDRLKEAMLQRAYDLMWDGDGLACDALSEFLPERDVTTMFDAWENDQFPEKDRPRSRFYDPKG
jgi:hypothetical protein